MQNLPHKIRSKKLSTKVDLTAMVSVSFLLIIFFIVTIELSKPKAVDLSLPNATDWTCGRITNCGAGTENRIVTVLLDKNDTIIMYSGLFEDPQETPKKVVYGKDGIRKVLLSQQVETLKYSTAMGKPKNGLIVIIKPSKKCNFKNLVDILDEMTIAKIDTYAIVNEFTPEESKLLALK